MQAGRECVIIHVHGSTIHTWRKITSGYTGRQRDKAGDCGVRLAGKRMKGQFKGDCERGIVGDRVGIKGDFREYVVSWGTSCKGAYRETEG